MKTFLTVFLVLGALAVFIYFWSKKDYSIFIKNLAQKYSFDEIDEKIENFTKQINSKRYKGQMLSDLLDERNIWEQVKTYKKNKL